MVRKPPSLVVVVLLVLTILSIYTIVLFPVMLIVDVLYWRWMLSRKSRPIKEE